MFQETSAPAQQVAQSLPDLGARTRAWRARRGMSRKQLASDSGLSERFLADLESGKGNASINTLDAVAGALSISLLDLLQDAPRPALGRVMDLVAKLSDEQLDAAHEALSAQFGIAGAVGRAQRVALLGLRGAGKSTLGVRLAKAQGVPFIELDREMEREAGMRIPEIITEHGQAGYRRYERRALLRVAQENAAGVVLSTGGSIVSERETFDLLQSHFYCVWVKASPEEHMGRVVAQGDMRPFDATSGANVAALDDIRSILASRAELYARADAVVDTSARSTGQSFKDLQRAITA